MTPRNIRPGDAPPLGDIFGLVEMELEKAVIKPSIYRYEPYSDQVAFHTSTAPGKYCTGGNRAGKTTAGVIEAIWWATDTHPYRERPEEWGHGALQIRFVCVDIAKGVEQILLPAFKRWLPREYMVDGSWDKSWDDKNKILTLANGSEIDFLTYNMDLERHGGVPRHLIFFDEEPPRHLFNEAMMRLRDYDGFWAILATPVQGMTWTYDLLWEPALDAKREGRTDFPISIHELDPANNPYLQAEDTSRFFIAMDKEERDMRETGKFVARSGLVFPHFNLDTHVIDPVIPPRHWAWYSSVDHGFNNPTAWYWHAVSPAGNIITFAEHYESEMTVEQHASVVLERESGWKKTVDRRVGDPAMHQRQGVTGTSIVQEYARRGVYIITDGIPHDVMIGVEKMQQYFQVRRQSDGTDAPMWLITSNCRNLIRELRKLRWASYDSAKKNYSMNRQEKIHKKDDHGFDSVRYFSTLMPNLAPASSSHLQLLKPGELGSLSEVWASAEMMAQHSQAMAPPPKPQHVSWDSTTYTEEMEQA